jgi:hypothetical protein
MSQSVAPSALKTLEAFQTPRSRTGLLNAAASRLVEWFHSTTQESCQKTKNLNVCFADELDPIQTKGAA